MFLVNVVLSGKKEGCLLEKRRGLEWAVGVVRACYASVAAYGVRGASGSVEYLDVE